MAATTFSSIEYLYFSLRAPETGAGVALPPFLDSYIEGQKQSVLSLAGI